MLKRLLAIVAVLSLGAPVISAGGAAAATPKKGATYGGKVQRVGRSRDPWIALTVSTDGKTLDAIGPAERCGGYSPLSAFHGRINAVAITGAGKFRGTRAYDLNVFGGTLLVHWDASIAGRFVSQDKARGHITFRMTYTGMRSHDCGLRHLDFTAERGSKWPGLLPPAS